MIIVLGDFVSLKSGGPPMRIDGVGSCFCCVRCTWNQGTCVRSQIFHLGNLRSLVGRPFVSAVVRRRREAN